jgi:hypothetical protein
LTLQEWPKWQEIHHWAYRSKFGSPLKAEALRAAVHACEEKFRGKKIPFHFVHGDFTPWNILMGNKGLMVLDWEKSDPVGLPFTDLIHFAMTRRVLIEEKHVPMERFLRNPISVLKIDAEFNNLQELLKFPVEIVNLSAIHESWLRRQWRHSLI